MKLISVVAVLLILGMIYSCCNSTTQTMSETLPTLTDFNGINTSSIRSTNGLSLSLSLDAKTYKPGDTINMVVSEWNTLKKTNKLLVSDKWPVNRLNLSLSGTLSRPFGIAIFQGDYTAAAIPAVTPLVLYNPNGIVQGGIPPVLNITAFNFQPSSDIATIESSNPNQNLTIEMSFNVKVWNYWAGDRPNAVLHNFEPGVYTVVAGDEWGALVVLHFTIVE